MGAVSSFNNKKSRSHKYLLCPRRETPSAIGVVVPTLVLTEFFSPLQKMGCTGPHEAQIYCILSGKKTTIGTNLFIPQTRTFSPPQDLHTPFIFNVVLLSLDDIFFSTNFFKLFVENKNDFQFESYFFIIHISVIKTPGRDSVCL